MKERPFGEDDLEAVLAVLSADETQLLGRPSVLTLGDIGEWTRGVDLAHDSWLFEDVEGIAGVGWTNLRDGLGFAVGVVHPRAKGRGIGAQLVDRSESNLVGRGAARIHQFAIGADDAARRLMLARGYRDVRHFFDMAIQLEARPEVPDVEIETFREEDARVFHAALDEAFQDHWEHHSRPFEDWWERNRASSGYDPSLWFVVRDGDELAAVVRNEANRNGGGYVAAIGVRRRWRGRGYAKALLLHTFREFYDRGFPRVTLGVDAENPTGATQLYESVGMAVEQENVVFEKAVA
jgi:mycothiol synthase